jgi:hypothetical protein
MSQEPLNPDLAAVETAMASLAPRPSTIDRDRLMFLAGQATRGRDRAGWLWPLSTAASLMVAVGLVALLVVRGEPQTVERIVYVPSESPVKAVAVVQVAHETEALSNYLRMRRLMIEQGLDKLPESSSSDPGTPHSTPSFKQRDLLRHLLNG